jgi:hypothetical protein
MLYRAQGGMCPIGRHPLGETFVVDHDHFLAAHHTHPVNVGCERCVRGLLCGTHNTAIGFFHDSPDELRQAAAWAERRRVQ